MGYEKLAFGLGVLAEKRGRLSLRIRNFLLQDFTLSFIL
jgi:hypothetical protein